MLRIMISGPSGIGKTTIAKHLAERFNINYISGSISDLMPDTKGLKHSDMLSKTSEQLVKEDYQLINLRNKLFKLKTDFVTDRSYLDSAAYFLYKQSTKLPTCEVDQFINLCKMLISQQCDLLVLFGLVPEDINNWLIENNDKRILNTYYQIQMSSIMTDVLKYMGMEVYYTMESYKPSLFTKSINFNRPVTFGNISSPQGDTSVLIIPDLNKDHRISLLEAFITKLKANHL